LSSGDTLTLALGLGLLLLLDGSNNGFDFRLLEVLKHVSGRYRIRRAKPKQRDDHAILHYVSNELTIWQNSCGNDNGTHLDDTISLHN
jgi:hypothetical protein